MPARGRVPWMRERFPSSRSQPGMRVGDDDYGADRKRPWARDEDGRTKKERVRLGRPPGGFPRVQIFVGTVIRSRAMY